SQPLVPPLVIAGTGTLTLEIIQHVPDLDYVVVQVGGGGLAAGVAILLHQLVPEIKIICVVPKDTACLKHALDNGEQTDLT
ncbi:pyridoxal-phosphate dependent enzyme, partial [Haemophilus influenzae]|uniref:pyridoxal-phosphate dependent enzyme n=1 Tax=Haemophilus influenzae TaxID=727 RepID=UPI0018AF8742